jgi:TonB family protein
MRAATTIFMLRRPADDLFGAFIIGSIIFHIIVFIAIPLTIKLLRKPETFASVATVQLVRLPQALAAPQKEAAAKPKAKPATPAKPVPAKNPRAAAKKEEVKPEENLDELQDLLGDMQPATQFAVAGNFKYDWYLTNVRLKTERFWNPPADNPDLAVVVSFTIFSDGGVSDVTVRQTSGNSTLDNLAIRAVALAAPFGKLPPGYSENRLDLTCTFRPVRR